MGKLGKFTMGWDFEPKCHFGACATRSTDFTNEGLSSVLTRVGARYSGSDNGKFTGGCGRVVGTSTITIKIRVTKAEAVAGEVAGGEARGHHDREPPRPVRLRQLRGDLLYHARLGYVMQPGLGTARR